MARISSLLRVWRTDRVRTAAAVAAAATALTAIMAAPVLRRPTEWTVGSEFAGRYRDPFVVMHQYGTGHVPAPFFQPATDGPGVLLGRRLGGIASYNAIDLLSFPLSAVSAWALAWRLTRSKLAASIAAFAFAWSPFHIAQASYHLHVAQVQWLPLYLLCIWQLMERRSWAWGAAAAAAGAVLAAASFYWMLIAAVITPIALIAAAALVPADGAFGRGRIIALASGLAIAIVSAAAVFVLVAPIWMPGDPSMYAFPEADQTLYSARWTSYLMPAFDQPLVSAWVISRVPAMSVVEQQVGPGWAVLLLAGAGAVMALHRGRARGAAIWLIVIAAAAVLCSTDPIARWLFAMTPMFRSYARFGGVVTLCAAVLSGIGAAELWKGQRTRPVAIVMLILAVVELRPYAIRARDVLPTPGYRYLADQPVDWRLLDCTPPGREYGPSVTALLDGRVGFREPPFNDCGEPDIAGTLARLGYTHLLVRNGSREGRWMLRGGGQAGLQRVASSPEDQVFAVTAPPSGVYVSAEIGFHDREYDGTSTWRWMSRESTWLVINTHAAAVTTALDVRATAFHGARHLEAWTPEGRAATIAIDAPDWYRLAPIELPPGETAVTFRVPEGDVRPADVLGNGDLRSVAIRLDDWRWSEMRPDHRR
jgi:hypothetical protein